jgi:hypothetical protein
METAPLLSRLGKGAVACLAVIAAGSVAWGAESATPSPDLLEKTGQRVKQFWDDLASVACTETLVQEKLNEKDKPVLASRASYDYLISLRFSGNDLLVDESRLELGQPQKKKADASLLATRGFATLLLILHPEFQPSYYFTFLQEETLSGRKVARVGFVPRTGSRSPGALELKGREFPIAWEGTAWIDPSAGTVLRVQAHWKDPAEEIGLETLSSNVTYAPVILPGNRTFWLPEAALIEVKTRYQHWRNSHRFSNYRLFSVEVDSKVEGAKK